MDPDPLLLRAGFLVLRATPSLRGRIGELIAAVSRSDAYKELNDPRAEIEFLGTHLPQSIKMDSLFCRETQTILEDYRAELGVVVTDCPE